LAHIFLHFRQLYFYSRQVSDKGLANRTAITDTSTLNGFATGMLSMVLILGNIKSGLEFLQQSYNLF